MSSETDLNPGQIQLRLSLPEVNQVLHALGQLPYADVHQLIANIHTQAEVQLNGTEEPQQ